MDNFGLNQEQVAERCGKSRSAVANSIRLLALPSDILELIKIGELTAGHGRAILSIEDPELREKAVIMAQKGATVRDLEKLGKKRPEAKTKAQPKLDNYFREMEIALKNDIGRRVKIEGSRKKDQGTITIEYYSKEDLAAIAAKLSEK